MAHSIFSLGLRPVAALAASLALISSVSLVARPRTNGQEGPIRPVFPVDRDPPASPLCHGALLTGLPSGAPTLAGAQSDAKGLWSAMVVQNVGQAMSDWNYAQQRSLQCNAGNIAGTFTCRAKANPCKPA